MGSGDIIGKRQSIPESRRLDMNDQSDNDGGLPRAAKARQQQMCGSMNEQRTDSGGYAQPQGFVRLVGHRVPKARPPRAPG